MACRTMQLRFLKLGTVLTYAFNPFVNRGQQIASQIQQTNPELVEQVRQMRRANNPSPGNNNQEGEGTGDDSVSEDQPPPAQ